MEINFEQLAHLFFDPADPFERKLGNLGILPQSSKFCQTLRGRILNERSTWENLNPEFPLPRSLGVTELLFFDSNHDHYLSDQERNSGPNLFRDICPSPLELAPASTTFWSQVEQVSERLELARQTPPPQTVSATKKAVFVLTGFTCLFGTSSLVLGLFGHIPLRSATFAVVASCAIGIALLELSE
ncbi:MAG: hypothetical protein HQM15_01220 [Deltaproteobacteria bacterium]|nr:hypothetical protein [Deltaproteobacteria bacterium]